MAGLLKPAPLRVCTALAADWVWQQLHNITLVKHTRCFCRLTEALAGTTALATAWQERDAKGLSNTLSCRFENGALTGMKSWVAGMAAANGILVVAEAGGGPALALVEPGGKGIAIDKRRQSDGSILAELHLSGAPAELLAKGPAVAKALEAAVSDTTALTAAELIGVSAKALEITLDYIKTRVQFDKPIGSFQVIQHRAVDMHVMQEVAEAGVRDALGLMDATEAPRLRARQASRAKARACTTARKITREAIQLHGGIGTTDEHDAGMFLKRARVAAVTLGYLPDPLAAWIFVTLLAFLAILKTPAPLEGAHHRVGNMLLAMAYAGALLPMLGKLRDLDDGLSYCLAAIFCTWGSDTGAYFVGKAIGKRKLFELVSPKKTLEGALGGVPQRCLITSICRNDEQSE